MHVSFKCSEALIRVKFFIWENYDRFSFKFIIIILCTSVSLAWSQYRKLKNFRREWVFGDSITNVSRDYQNYFVNKFYVTTMTTKYHFPSVFFFSFCFLLLWEFLLFSNSEQSEKCSVLQKESIIREIGSLSERTHIRDFISPTFRR